MDLYRMRLVYVDTLYPLDRQEYARLNRQCAEEEACRDSGPRLSGSEEAVLGRVRWWEERGETCCETVSEMGKALGMSKHTLCWAIRRLIARGLLTARFEGHGFALRRYLATTPATKEVQ